MNTDLRKKSKEMIFFFKLMNNPVFGKNMENVRKYRDIKLVTTERRRNYLVSEPNKSVYLRLSILELSKTLMDEFWYDYVKPKYGEKSKFCFMDTKSFLV